MPFRFYLEKFFNDIAQEFRNVSSAIHVVINETATVAQLKNFRSNDPLKSGINAILQNPKVQSVVWMRFNLSSELPVFPTTLLYGALSEIIHNPDVRGLVVSDAATSSYKAFFSDLAGLYKVKYTEYEEEQATVAPELLDLPISPAY
jgi:hypothetical protein